MFHKDTDYAAFLALLQMAKSKYPVRVLGFCLMPNHFHLVLQPATADALSPFMVDDEPRVIPRNWVW